MRVLEEVLDTAYTIHNLSLSKCMYTTLPDLEGNDKIEVVLVALIAGAIIEAA